jgi:hypothetical protein
MKRILVIIVVSGLACCKNSHEKAGQKNAIPVRVQSFDSACKFDKILRDNATPQLAKDIYLDKDWDLRNDSAALALLDSLLAINLSSRPFYFKVVIRSHKKSDGYYSEALGLAGKELVENHTKEFAAYFDNTECFTKNDLATWANIVLLEIELEQDNVETTKEEHIIYPYCRKLRKQSEGFPLTQKQTMATFTHLLESKWSEWLKNI